jgi:hypothetical protein
MIIAVESLHRCFHSVAPYYHSNPELPPRTFYVSGSSRMEEQENREILSNLKGTGSASGRLMVQRWCCVRVESMLLLVW